MASQARSASGGVRNLRAMFEQKEETAPTSSEYRGRSPAGSYGGGGSNGTSPRPLSKVRTSFVAVERSGGQVGLRLSNEAENGPSQNFLIRRASSSMEGETDLAGLHRTDSTNSDVDARKKSKVMTESIPESAVLETPPIETAKRGGYINGNGAKVEEAAKLTNGSTEKKGKKVVAAGSATAPAQVPKTENVAQSVAPAKLVPKGDTTKHPPVISSSKATTKPAHISTNKAPVSIKSSTTSKPLSAPKTPTSPVKIPKSPAKADKPTLVKATTSKPITNQAADSKPVKTASDSAPGKPGPRPATSQSFSTATSKKPAGTVSATGFVKPRPKSPTRPAKLPAGLTTHTASSQSKVASGSPPPPRRTSMAPNATNTGPSRSPSRVSLAPKLELRRTRSNIHSDRPALGRPPAASQRDKDARQSLPKRIAPADDNFLARMMRPTTSSASKVADKQITPPRERATSTTRPQTRDSSTSHKAHEVMTGSPASKKMPLTPKLAKQTKAQPPQDIEPTPVLAFKKEETSIEPTKQNDTKSSSVKEEPVEHVAVSSVKSEAEETAASAKVEPISSLETVEESPSKPIEAIEEVKKAPEIIVSEPKLPEIRQEDETRLADGSADKSAAREATDQQETESAADSSAGVVSELAEKEKEKVVEEDESVD